MDAAPLVIPHTQLVTWGYAGPRLRAALEQGVLLRLRHGVYAMGDAWESARPEERILARAAALATASAVSPVLSHETAAACHDIPLYAPDDARVHVIAPDGRPGAAAGVIRHRGELPESEVVEVRGLRITGLLRTVADIARTAMFEQAVTVADAALRRLCTSEPHVYDEDAARHVRAAVLAIAKRSAHGVSRAERVLRFADGRAQLPGESVSRIRLARLGFRRVRLQLAVPKQHRGFYYVDFGLDDVPALGEFDGRIKYRDATLHVDRSADETLDREKQREDWIRGVTQLRVARWGWPHLQSADRLGARLAAFGIRAP